MNYPIMLVFFALGVTANRYGRTPLYRICLVAALTAVVAIAVTCEASTDPAGTYKRYTCTLEDESGILELKMLDRGVANATARAKEVQRQLAEQNDMHLEFKGCKKQ